MELGKHVSICRNASDLNSSELRSNAGKTTENRHCCLPARPGPGTSLTKWTEQQAISLEAADYKETDEAAIESSASMKHKEDYEV
jgi:hypothetical protein